MNNVLQRTSSTILLLLFLAAFALRIYHLDAQSLWYDEGVTATLAQRELGALTAWTARDIQPPLYYYVVAGWGRLAGWSEWSLRFVSAWWGTLAVPLMALLAYKLFQKRSTALVAALLTSVHPLLVYYSQEARMYTMVVALMILAAYYLVQALGTLETPRLRPWLWYVGVATAAVYTHYFAFFLLLAFGLVGLLRTARERRGILPLILAHLAVVLLFVLWLLPLFTQFTSDRSYWEGTFKISEALRLILLRFVVGETVLEQFATKYLWLAAAVSFIMVALLLFNRWRYDRRWYRHWQLLLVSAWLVIPTLSVLLLAIAVPKFNVRYVLLALPGLLLFWSAGATTLYSAAPRHPIIQNGVMALTTIPLVAIFLLANYNWYTDHSFLKAQWREAAAYVRLHHEPGEAVVLVSGHTWPVWDYYAPDFPAIHLPDLQILDVDAVLDFETSSTALREKLQGYSGAWLVNWQEEVVDPTGVVPIQLGWAGREKTFRSQFWEVGLRRFIELDPAAIPVKPPLAERLDANFGNELILTGYNTTAEDELLLFWQLAPNAAATETDWQLTLHTQTESGLSYHMPADRRPTDYHYPVTRWRSGETVMAMIPALEWAGPAAMPGRYQIQMQIYNPDGDPGGLDVVNRGGLVSGKSVTLPVTLRGKTTDRPLREPTDAVEVNPGLRLSIIPSRFEAEAGETLATTLLWYPADDFVADDLAIRWRRTGDQAIVMEMPLPTPPDLPLSEWPTRDWFRQVVAVPIPDDLAPGTYHLSVEPAVTTTPDPARVASQSIVVNASSRTFIAPEMAVTYNIDLVEQAQANQRQFRLLGLRQAVPTTLEPGSQLVIAPIWQVPPDADAPMHDYTMSIQFLDETGHPAAQNDLVLSGGSHTWLPGQVVAESVALSSPPAPGVYRLILVVYDANRDGFPRLQTTTGADFIELAPAVWQP